MIPYIKTIIEEFPEEISNVTSSPASDHLFQVRDKEEAVPLNKEKMSMFKTAILFFLSSTFVLIFFLVGKRMLTRILD